VPRRSSASADAFRGLSEHRLDRWKTSSHKSLEAFLAFGERGCRDRTRPPARIAPPPHALRGRSAAFAMASNISFERALTQLAEEQAREEILLGRGSRRAKARRAVSGVRPRNLLPWSANVRKLFVDLREGEPGRACGRCGRASFSVA